MIIEHFLVAKSSSVDSDTNSLSVFELVEDLTVQIAPKDEDPQALVPLQIIAIIKRTDEVGILNINCRFVLEDPNGKFAVEQNVPIVIQSNFIRFRARLIFPLLLKRPGVYKFKVSVDDDPALVKVLESNITFV